MLETFVCGPNSKLRFIRHIRYRPFIVLSHAEWTSMNMPTRQSHLLKNPQNPQRNFDIDLVIIILNSVHLLNNMSKWY
jgi:hypothetical protein